VNAHERAADRFHRADAAACKEVHAEGCKPSAERLGEVFEGLRARAHHTDDGAAKVVRWHDVTTPQDGQRILQASLAVRYPLS